MPLVYNQLQRTASFLVLCNRARSRRAARVLLEQQLRDQLHTVGSCRDDGTRALSARLFLQAALARDPDNQRVFRVHPARADCMQLVLDVLVALEAHR